MSRRSPERVHVEAIVGMFKVLNAKRLSADSIAATCYIPREFVRDTLEWGLHLGFFGEVDEGVYELTPKGERLSEKILLRC